MLSLAVILPASADPGSKKGDNKAMRKELLDFRMKFIAQEIELRDDQQKQFFDVYTKMWEEKEKVHHEVRSLKKKLKEDSKLSDSEFRKISTAVAQGEEKEAEIVKRYQAQFAKFLSSAQISKMKIAEDKFKAKLKAMRDSKGKKK